jgi:RNA polymerase sigma-70 factor (ECF subfamily)
MAVEPLSGESTESDAELIARVQSGDVDAFAPLVRRHLPGLRAFVALRLPIANIADEITHETFVFAFRRIAEFDTQKLFRPWLRAIAWNLVRAELQRFAREQANLSRFEQAQLAGLQHGIELESAPDEAFFLDECLAELPAGMRRLVEERYRCGLSAEEIGSSIGRTVEWVRVTLFRVRKQLRACIEGKLAGSSHVS